MRTGPEDSQDKKIVLCINQWSSEEAIYSWYWVKSHILRGSQAGYFSCTLYILHVSANKAKERDARWDRGGPTTPDVRTAVSGFAAHIVELEGDAGGCIVDFVKQQQVDLLVLGTKSGSIRRKVLGRSSTTENVVRKVDCPCLIIKPKLAIGDTVRIKTAVSAATSLQTEHQLSSSPPGTRGGPGSILFPLATPKPSSPLRYTRRVAILFDTLQNARALFAWVAKHVLMPSDTIFAVRVVPSRGRGGGSGANAKGSQAVQAAQEFGGTLDSLITEMLPGFSIATMYQLARNDVKHGSITFVAEEGIDLLIAGRSTGRSRGQACTGSGIVSHLYKNAGCPTLVVKLQSIQAPGTPGACRPEADDLLLLEEELMDTASEEGDTEDEGPDSTDEVDELQGGGAGAPGASRLGPGVVKPIKTSPADLASPWANPAAQQEHVAQAVEGLVQKLLASGQVQLQQPMTHFWVQVDHTGKVAGLVPLKVPPPDHSTVETPTSTGASLSIDVSLDSSASLVPPLPLAPPVVDTHPEPTTPLLSPAKSAARQPLSPPAAPTSPRQPAAPVAAEAAEAAAQPAAPAGQKTSS